MSLRFAPATAALVVRTGQLLRGRTPAMARAVQGGKVSWEHAVAIRHAATSQLRKDALGQARYVDYMGTMATGDEQLVYHATRLDAGMFAVLAKRAGAQAEPQADERGYRQAQEREFVDLSPNHHPITSRRAQT